MEGFPIRGPPPALKDERAKPRSVISDCHVITHLPLFLYENIHLCKDPLGINFYTDHLSVPFLFPHTTFAPTIHTFFPFHPL